ncbi:MAG: hypothetical protein U9N09_00920, partial [Euryarchaeota archaeon]|nr:hypothetical protein [Euryarchaeota archaeon]
IIAEKYEQKDFIGASEILEVAKKTFETTSEELAERVSRSIRVPAPTYLKLVETALRGGVSLASVMRTVVLGPAIKSALDELSRRPEVAPDRLSRVEAVFEDWIEPESVKQREYFLDFTYERSLEVCELLTRYTEFEFFRLCAKLDVPKKAAELYWSYVVSPSDTLYSSWLMRTKGMDIHKSYDMIISEGGPSLIVGTIFLEYKLQLGLDYVNKVSETAMNDIREKFGKQISNSMVTAIAIRCTEEYKTIEDMFLEEDIFVEDILRKHADKSSITMPVNTGIIRQVKGDRVYLGGIEVCEENRDEIAKQILEGLHGTILDEDAVRKEVQSAINAGDLGKASELSAKLVESNVHMSVAEWITNSLFSAIETSEVITFTIPPIFTPILNFLQETKQIPDLVEQYLQKGQVNADS